jgi:uncharacterized protein (TIRG00374 family)
MKAASATGKAVIQRLWLIRSLAVLAAFTGIYMAVAVWIGFDAWRAAMRTISARGLLAVIGLVTAGFLIRALRWHYYCSRLGWTVPAGPRFTAFVASFAFTATPGKAGELVKALLLRGRYEISLTQAAGVLLIERLGDLVAVVILALGGLALFADLDGYFAVAALLIGLVALVAAHPAIGRAVVTRLAAIPKLRPVAEKLLTALDATRQLTRPLPVLCGGGMALAAWTCEALAFHLLIGSFGFHCSFAISFSIYGLSTLAGALSMLPGGLGGVEAVMLLLLTRLAAPAAVAAIAVMIFRLLTLWLFSIIGAAFLLGWVVFLARPAGRQLPDSR